MSGDEDTDNSYIYSVVTSSAKFAFGTLVFKLALLYYFQKTSQIVIIL